MDYSPWNYSGQNIGVGNLSPLQGIIPTQGSNPGLLHCRWILYQLSHKGSPNIEFPQPACPNTCAALPTINIPARVAYLLHQRKLHRSIIATQCPKFNYGSLLVLYVVWVFTNVWHASIVITCRIVILPWNLLHSIFSSLLLPLPSATYCLQNFTFSRMSYSQNHRVCNLFKLGFPI